MSTRRSMLSLTPRLASLLGVMAVSALPACQPSIDGNGQRSVETRGLRDFSRVRTVSSLDVRIDSGASYLVTVSIDSNLQRQVVVRVDGDELVIDLQGAIGDMVGGPHVLVQMPTLARVALDGSGWLTAASFRQDESVALDLEGSGDLAFAGEAPSITARLGGSGALRIDGSAAAVDLALDGSGNIDARNCAAGTANVSLGGSGSVSATVTGSTRVSLSGSGDIDLFGGGTIERLALTGSGEVHTHERQ